MPEPVETPASHIDTSKLLKSSGFLLRCQRRERLGLWFDSVSGGTGDWKNPVLDQLFAFGVIGPEIHARARTRPLNGRKQKHRCMD